MTGRKWVLVGYAFAFPLLAIGLTLVYMSATGVPLYGRLAGFRELIVGILFSIGACAATDFFSQFAKLGQDVLLSELPARTFHVVDRNWGTPTHVRLREMRQNGRTYNVRLSHKTQNELPEMFYHCGKGVISSNPALLMKGQ